MDGPQVELPRYRCHKEVWALKITGITHNPDGSGVLDFDPDTGAAPMKVDADYVKKHLEPRDKSIVGGYWVRYEGGYESYSPSDVFESGYMRIDGNVGSDA